LPFHIICEQRTFQITFSWNFIAKTGIPDSFLRRYDNTSQQAVSFQTPPQMGSASMDRLFGDLGSAEDEAQRHAHIVDCRRYGG